MKRTATLVAIVVMGVCSITTALSPHTMANSAPSLKTSLSATEIRSLQAGAFKDIPTYPESELSPDLSACRPNSFAMLGFLSQHGTVSGIASYYRHRLPKLGWSLVDLYGISKSEYKKAGAATLTFQKGVQVLTLDITHRTRRTIQYSLFAYDAGQGPGPRTIPSPRL